ncbi:hypothetical protein [Zhihengliuella halotolerans]|uniref:hypothetical protein n=1 Tax=Zhihengliuella halotolerans TaxID=370736 RepID=UPI000C7F8314|nr:hypothetical protein [Zhihengliuella halotolerans]
MLVPADIEFAVAKYLEAAFAAQGWPAVPVGTKIRDDADSFVVAFTTGGPNRTLVSGEDRIVFDCYAERELPAQQLAARVFALIRDLDCRRVGGIQFYDVEPRKPANAPHPDKPALHRYQFNATIHARYLSGT